MVRTFKEINNNAPIVKTVVKSGLSLAIVFNKEELQKYNIKYGSRVKLDNAELMENKEDKDI